jgi:very-short-patch-repair endonuclease
MSRYEEQLARQLQLRGLPPPERQFGFAMPHRHYRVDFAWPEKGLVVEVDGGTFVGRGGRGQVVSRAMPIGYHQTPEDYRKRNLLNLLGWRVLAYQPEQIARGEALFEIEFSLGLAEAPPVAPLGPNLRLLEHVKGLAAVDQVRRRARRARAAHREAIRAINHEARRTFPRTRR